MPLFHFCSLKVSSDEKECGEFSPSLIVSTFHVMVLPGTTQPVFQDSPRALQPGAHPWPRGRAGKGSAGLSPIKVLSKTSVTDYWYFWSLWILPTGSAWAITSPFDSNLASTGWNLGILFVSSLLDPKRVYIVFLCVYTSTEPSRLRAVWGEKWQHQTLSIKPPLPPSPPSKAYTCVLVIQ